jgi:hypothetical protein
MPFQPKSPAVSREQRQLWQEINDTIRECGGWSVSEPGIFPIRFECEIESRLPELLVDLGHSLRRLGTHERLMPVVITEGSGNTKITSQHVEPGIAAVFELSLIKKPDLVARR